MSETRVRTPDPELAEAVQSMKRKLAEIEKPRRRPHLRLVRPGTRAPRERRDRVRRERRRLHLPRPRLPRVPRPSLRAMRGTRQRERRLRKMVFFLGLVTLAFSVMVWLMMARSEPEAWKVTTGIAGVGGLLVLISVVARPIPKVTWRAWLAGRWHGRHARRAAVNESGYKSARAKRSATNKAAWAAQRARDGRAAAAPYSRKSEKLNAEVKVDRQRRALESSGSEWWASGKRIG